MFDDTSDTSHLGSELDCRGLLLKSEEHWDSDIFDRHNLKKIQFES